MVSINQISPLGRNGTFGTPLKGGVPSCPAFGPSYGRTFCDNVTPCPVLSRKMHERLKFNFNWIELLSGQSECAFRCSKCFLRACCTRQTVPQCYLSANQANYHQVVSRCVEDFSNTRVAIHHDYNMMGAVLVSQLPATKTDRLNLLGYKEASPRKTLQVLDARGKLLVEYQIFGCPHEFIRQYTRAAPVGEDPARRVPLQPGWPLTLEEAADVLRIKRRNARWICQQPVFQKEFAQQLQSLRSGLKAKALLAQSEILDDRGDGSAADRKVRLAASQAILSEEGRSSSVNVVVNNGIQLSAGIVVRLPHDAAPVPLEAIETRK